jgi:hypothetical protein
LAQPLLGSLQHRYYKANGRTSVFGYAHRWIGRGAIILGIINSGLGLQLASGDIEVPKSSYIRNFVLAGTLVSIWLVVALFASFARPKTGPSLKADGIGEGGKHVKEVAA